MMLNLSYGIKFEDLYNSEHVVDKAFLDFLHSQNIDLYNALIYARSAFILEAKRIRFNYSISTNIGRFYFLFVQYNK